jgi:hypothetical protein
MKSYSDQVPDNTKLEELEQKLSDQHKTGFSNLATFMSNMVSNSVSAINVKLMIFVGIQLVLDVVIFTKLF